MIREIKVKNETTQSNKKLFKKIVDKYVLNNDITEKYKHLWKDEDLKQHEEEYGHGDIIEFTIIYKKEDGSLRIIDMEYKEKESDKISIKIEERLDK